MKKLVMALAAVAVAAGVQAASISWSSEFNFVDADGNTHTSATAPAGAFVLCYLGNTTDGYSFDDATVVNQGSVLYTESKGVTVAKASGSYAFTYSESNSPVNNGDVFAVMFKDDKGNLSKLETVDGDPIETTFTVTGLGNNTYSGSYTFASSAYTAVPEPTSGLLLLLGMAGLALRRKQK